MQARYKAEWLELTSQLNLENRFDGYADIWGGGALNMWFWFDDEGHLWDEMKSFSGKYILHKLTKDELGIDYFVNGHTAVVYIPYSASFTLGGTLYVLSITNGNVYRTEDAWGWSGKDNHATVKNWDKKSIPPHSLYLMAENIF